MMLRFPPGSHISRAAEMLVAAAEADGEAAGTFNGITLKAVRGSSASDIVADFTLQYKLRSEAYAKSPEGIAAAQRRVANRVNAQAVHDASLAALSTLDFADQGAVLDWLCGIQQATDHSGVKVDKAAILDAFEKHGFLPGVNCGPDFNEADRDNHHRWLVGQALETLKFLAIHQVIHKFAAEWKAQFLPPTEGKEAA